MGRWTDAARLVRSAMDKAGDCLTDAQAAESAALFMPWRAETEYQAGDRVTYYGTLYKCLQAHTSQAAWIPPDSPSLWVRIDDPAIEWPDWVMPTGSTDAYAKGAKVTHNSKHWVSDVDANVWEPGAPGTEGTWIEQ